MIDMGKLLMAAFEGNDVGMALIEVDPSENSFQLLHHNQIYLNFCRKFSTDKYLKNKISNLNFREETIFSTKGKVLSTHFEKFDFPDGNQSKVYYIFNVQDITTAYKQEEELAWRMRFELGVSSSLQILIGKPSVSSALPQALHQLLYFTDMDTVFFLKYIPDNAKILYEILADEKRVGNQKSLPTEIESDWETLGLTRWHTLLIKGEVLYLNKKKAKSKEKWYFNSGVEDILLIPVNLQNNYLGILGFENLNKSSNIKEENILVYQSIASWLAIFLEREEAMSELDHYKSSLEKLVIEKTTDLDKTKTELEKAYQTKSNFLSHISHELRTPLNSILGFSRLIQLPKEDEIGNEYLGYIISAGQRLLSMINDILGLMKLESGNMKLYEVNMDPIEVFENSKRLISPLSQAKGMEVQACVYGNPYAIYSDPGKIQQILTNLLSNAVKYGGAFPFIEFNLHFEDNQILFYVADKGSGISEDDQKKLFQNFSRLTEDGNIEGTGLGLSISKKLAELLGGRIELQSSKGLGSKFTLIIPKEKK